MKSKKRRIFCMLCCIVLITFPLTSFAHSGRTDANGGHHDYKNKSGLGDYHYHHGMGPHLHPNGVCPYSGGAAESSGGNSDSQESVSTYTPPAPSIVISDYPETLDVGASAGFEYSVSNATGNDSSVTSSDPAVVKVNANGTLTAVKEGTAQITIQASGAEKTFSVTVRAVPVEEVKISNEMKRLQLGKEHSFQISILPENATNKNVSWTSDNEAVLEISNSGVATAKAEGTATVTVTTENKLEAKTTVEVYEVLPETIDCDDSIQLIVGDEAAYEINVFPRNANRKEFSVSCEDESILKYSESSVCAVSEGETTLHIETWNGIQKDIPVKVDSIPVESIEIKDATEYINANMVDKSDMISLSTKINPENATYQEVEWSSSDNDIVRIQNGEFIIQGTGEVTLTCTAHGGMKNSVTIHIINKNAVILVSLAGIGAVGIIIVLAVRRMRKKVKK